MRKETRFLLWGMFAGLVLGIVVTLTVQYRQRRACPMATATANRHSATPKTMLKDNGATEIGSVLQARADGLNRSVSSVGSVADDSVAIRITSSCSITFSAAFAKVVRDLKAAGEPPDLVVNMVVAEFNRQWRDQMNAVNRKLRSGQLDQEESQEFFSSRTDALGETITEVLGEDSFAYWDKQRLLRSVSTGGYTLSAAESNELYRVEKEREQRNRELTRARDNGELDPLDYEEQSKKSEEQYQQERAKLLPEDRRARATDEEDNLLAALKQQTRGLNLSPQQLAELVDATRKNLVAMQGLESLEPAGHAEKLQALEAALESEWIRILGAQGYADFKKASDYRYQTMKRYQEVWLLSDNDINYLYQTFAKYDKSIEERNAKTPPVSESTDAEGKENSSAQTDNFADDMRQQLEAELLRSLGEERFRRFKAAGLIPQDE
jgi:hypothetical protein